MDTLLAAKTHAIGARVDAAKRGSHLTQPFGTTLKNAHGVIALAGVLDPVKLVRTRLNREGLAIPASVSQFGLPVLQGPSESVDFGLCHCLRSLFFPVWRVDLNSKT
jgi:hypothetical protein